MTNVLLNRSKKKILLFMTAFAVIVLLLIPIKIPYSLSSIAKAKPAKQWLIIKGTDGKLVTTLINNINGNVENYSVTQFERGDVVQFYLNKNIVSGVKVNEKDSIAFITSNLSEIEITQLKSELNDALAQLKLSESNEKESIVNTEKQKLEFSKKQYEEQQNLFNRQKSLYEKQLISQEEYELAKSSLELFKINVDISSERLSTVQTGSRPEEIEMIKSRIVGLQNQIRAFENKFDKYFIQTPINGIIQRTYSTDTLINIEDYSELIAFVPVKNEYLNQIKIGQTVNLEGNSFTTNISGKVINLQSFTQKGIAENFIIAQVRVEPPKDYSFSSSTYYSAKILIDECLPYEYLYKLLRNIFSFK